MEPIYTESFFLSAGEVNAEGEMSLPLLVAKFIDLATAHANGLHLGNPDMVEHHAGWVLSRIALQMESYPKANEPYSITTWVERWTRRFSVRCFMVSDQAGKPLGYARSVWMILSTTTRESLPLTIFDTPIGLEIKDRCPDIETGKHRVIAPYETEDTLPSDVLTSTIRPSFYTFQYCDLDFYRHVNTVRYVSLLLNQFPLQEMDNMMIDRLEMSFMHEGHYGETVEVRRHDESESLTAMSLVGQDGRDILFARISRQPRVNSL